MALYGPIESQERERLLSYRSVTSSIHVSHDGDGDADCDDVSDPCSNPYEPEVNEDDVKLARRGVRNFFIHCVSVMFILTSYQALQNLQSTLNDESGVGAAALTCVFVGLMVSCPLAPLVTQRLGFKWTMALSYVTQCLFAAANFYPRFYPLVPASLLLGLASGPFWTAQGMFLTTLALHYCRVMDIQPITLINRANGLFFMFFQSGQIWGNLISSLVLFNGAEANIANASDLIRHNDTLNVTSCGVQFCSRDAGFPDDATWREPAQETVTMLVGIYLGCCVVGLTLKCFFMDNVQRHAADTFEEEHALDVLLSMLVVHGQPLMLLLIPLFIFSGLEQGFLFGDYTSAFVGCQLGISFIGYTMISFGAASALSSFLVGRLQRFTGRLPLLLLAAAINGALLVFMLTWRPEEGPDWLFYFIPALWGVADSTWQTMLTSLIAVEFEHCRDPAFATLRFWQSTGLVISFAYSYQLCTLPKIYIALGLLAVAIVMYVAMEFFLKYPCRKKAYIDLYAPIVD